MHAALGDDLAVLGEQLVAVEPDAGALLDAGEHVLADVVEQRDAGVDEDLGTEVGIAAGDAGRGVDDGGDLAPDQRVGADPVDVDVVDDRDVAGLQPLGEVLGAAVQPDGAGDAGPGVLSPGRAEGCRCACRRCFHAALTARPSDARCATCQSRTVSDTTAGATRPSRAGPARRAGPLPTRD